MRKKLVSPSGMLRLGREVAGQVTVRTGLLAAVRVIFSAPHGR